MRVWHILCSLLFATDAAAHRFAPSLLEVTQLSATTFNAIWKTPLQKVSATPIEPRFPAACEITSASPWIQEGTGELKQIQLACPTGLVGETLSVSGLGQNQSSALLRITLADDIFHQAVFTATEPDFVVPKDSSAGTVALDYTRLHSFGLSSGSDTGAVHLH